MCGSSVECSVLCMRALLKLLNHHIIYKDVFREVGLIEVMATCLQRYAALLKDSSDSGFGNDLSMSLFVSVPESPAVADNSCRVCSNVMPFLYISTASSCHLYVSVCHSSISLVLREMEWLVKRFKPLCLSDLTQYWGVAENDKDGWTNRHNITHSFLALCTPLCHFCDYGLVLWLVDGEVCDVEQSLGSLAVEAVTLLLTANNSNAGELLHNSRISQSSLSVHRSSFCPIWVWNSLSPTTFRRCLDIGVFLLSHCCTVHVVLSFIFISDMHTREKIIHRC